MDIVVEIGQLGKSIKNNFIPIYGLFLLGGLDFN
jgi:hypothetical protein